MDSNNRSCFEIIKGLQAVTRMKDYWVGRLGKLGNLVFDPQLQLERGQNVVLFGIVPKNQLLCAANESLTKLTAPTNLATVETVIRIYEAWKKNDDIKPSHIRLQSELIYLNEFGNFPRIDIEDCRFYQLLDLISETDVLKYQALLEKIIQMDLDKKRCSEYQLVSLKAGISDNSIQIKRLTESISQHISDYRNGEIEPITPHHVEIWSDQFNLSGHEEKITFLRGIESVFSRFYYKKGDIESGAINFLSSECIFGEHPLEKLRKAYFLNEQKYGQSQKEMVDIVGKYLYKKYKVELNSCDDPEQYIYLDDCLFSGNRLINDIQEFWERKGARENSNLTVYYFAVHEKGMEYAKKRINEILQDKRVKFDIKYSVRINNFNKYDSKVEFLWPRNHYNNDVIIEWVERLKTSMIEKGRRTDLILRREALPKSEEVFHDSKMRDLVEKCFLEQGINILSKIKYENEAVRPLGFDKLDSLGFGSIFISQRNIATNCPIVLWFDGKKNSYPWIPLFKRKSTNEALWWF